MILKEEFLQQCQMAASSRSAPLSLDQCKQIFRNRLIHTHTHTHTHSLSPCSSWFTNYISSVSSDELLLFHQLFLRGLHHRIDQWPVVMLGKTDIINGVFPTRLHISQTRRDYVILQLPCGCVGNV